MKRITAILTTLTLSLTAASSAFAQKAPLTEQQTIDAAKEVYLFAFPMVMNLKTISEYVLETEGSQYKAPFNELKCEARLYTPEDTTIVTPNSDTPYCMGWLDLSNGPVVITLPEIEKERYFGLQLIDMNTHNIGYIGTRTHDNEAGEFLIAGPNWQGEVADNIVDVTHSETNQVLIIARAQVFDHDDLEKVRVIQDNITLSPLETNGQQAIADFPLWKTGAEATIDAFEYVDFALSIIDQHPDDEAVRALATSLGLGDNTFSVEQLTEQQKSAFEQGIQLARLEIQQFIQKNAADPLISHYILGTREHLTESAQLLSQEKPYIQRSTAALMGLYGNSGEEALYPAYLADAEGLPLNANQNNYQIRFNADEMPPVNAFWSLSMYDARTQLFINNALNRYLLNTQDENHFVKEEDGSIILYIQKDSPGKKYEANWLPAPDGPFYLVKRLYLPTEEVLQGKWTAPKIHKVSQ